MYKVILIISLVLFTSCSWIGFGQDEKPFVYVDKKDAILINDGDFANVCTVCASSLSDDFKTNHTARYEDSNYQYCSLHCFAKHLKLSKKIKNPKVIDVNSLKFIDVSKAYYVIDSDIESSKSDISKFAFSSLVDAREFQEENDGDVVNFYKALDVAREDFIEKSWYDIF